MMPRNAIATGVVDRVLTTDRLADAIVRFAKEHQR
jgi:chemotaxis response regulator CheB